MKSLTLIAFLLLTLCFGASAQKASPNILLDIIKGNKQKEISLYPGVKKIPSAPKAKLLSITGAGKIYALPLDNMPCFVPTGYAAMPKAILDLSSLQNNMPNALQVKPVIPKK